MSGDLLVEGGALWAGPGRYFPRGRVEVRSGRVTYAGPPRPAPWSGPRLGAGGGLIMPGLVNAHCHGAMTLFRGLADDVPLATWLERYIFPAEARLVNPEMTEVCTLLAIAEMLLSGTTCVGDAYFCMEGAARAYREAGMRAVLAQGVVDFPAPGVADPGDNLAVARRFLRSWQGVSPLVTPALFAHSVYTCSPATLRGVAELAAELGVPWFIHLSETREEVRQLRRQRGTTPARFLEELGLLSGLGAAVHGVWLEPAEVELLARRGVALVHCPESNLKLASGMADAWAWLKAGVVVGLGSDGPASNNDLDLLGEMGSAALQAKLKRRDPSALPAPRALDLALAGSARCLGLEGVVGRLEPGYAGDLIVLHTQVPHLTPCYDIPSHLVYAARGGDLRHAVVAGRVLVRDRRLLTIDLPRVMERVRRLSESLRN